MRNVLATILLIACMGCSSPTSEENDTAAVLKFEPNELVVTESGVTPLTLINHGKSSVQVTSINTTCGCTLPAGFNGLSLAPGESSVIEFEVTLPTYGTKRVHVTAETATAEKITAQATLNLRGSEPETPRLLDKPSLVLISGRQANELAEGHFSITTVEKSAEQWIQSGVCTDQGVEVKIVNVREFDRPTAETVRRAYDFRVLVSTPSKPGKPAQNTIELKSSSQPKSGDPKNNLYINIKAEYIPSVRALPAKIVVKSGSSAKHVLTLLFDEPGDWKVDVSEQLEYLTVKPRSSNARLKTFEVLVDREKQGQPNNAQAISFICSRGNEKIEVVVPIDVRRTPSD